MNQVVPPRFLFRWSFDALRIAGIPHTSGRLLDLPVECQLPGLEELDQGTSFGRISLAWNNQGFAVSALISGRSKRPECVIDELALSDRVEVWIDTRATQTAHRASKFCHHYALLPLGGGARQSSPVVRPLPIPRSREDAQLPDVEKIRIQAEVSNNSYQVETWFPMESLIGFDPQNYPRIGFHYLIHDTELGQQSIAGGSEFPYESDPSLWQTVVLQP